MELDYEYLKTNEMDENTELDQPITSFLELNFEDESPLVVLPYEEIEKKFKCTVCNRIFGAKKLVQSHIKSHELDLHYTDCVATFNIREQYQLHLQTHDKSNEADVNCQESELYLSVSLKDENGLFLKEDINQIKPSDTEVKMNTKHYICVMCTKSFKTKQQLNTHCNVHSDIKTYSCDICEKSFKLKQQLKTHFKVHEDNKPFECSLCEKAFKLKQQLDNHLKSHSDSRPFPCNFCNKSFKIKQQLQTHLRVHDDLRSFICDICYKGFKLKQQLQFHKRVHTGERPYLCDQCEKSFKFKQQLQHHLKVHTKYGNRKNKKVSNDSLESKT